MNKILYPLLGSCMLTFTLPAMTAEHMPTATNMDVKMMDTNSDGMVSKTEYMAYHEKMWMGMKKDTNGMVDAKMMQTQRSPTGQK